jgi:putative SOS response-associated peptidase YedK
MVLEFRPEGHEYMFVPCIWDEWKDKDGTILRSFALITDEPPPEIAATGHDRCPVFLKEENIDAWLQPSGKSDKELFAILDDRMRPKYRHALAA